MGNEANSAVTKKSWSMPQQLMIYCLDAFLVAICGQGFGKTATIAAKEHYMMQFAYAIGFITANTYGQLSGSTILGLTKYYESMGILDGRDYVIGLKPPPHFKTIYKLEFYHNVISYKNGKITFLGSLENWQAHEGKEVAYCLMDEVKGTREEAFKEMILGRVRQKGLYIALQGKDKGKIFWSDKDLSLLENNGYVKGYTQIAIFTSPSKEMWLLDTFKMWELEQQIRAKAYSDTDYFYHQTLKTTIIVASTFHNKANLSQDYIENLSVGKNSSEILRTIYGIPFVSDGGELIDKFDTQRHVISQANLAQVPFDRDRDYLYLAFDANKLPYCTCLVLRPVVKERFGTDSKEYRATDAKKIDFYVIDEICQYDNIADTCSEFVRRITMQPYKYCNDINQLRLYFGGDPTLNTAKEGMKAHESPYGIIAKHLERFIDKKVHWNLTKHVVSQKQIMPLHVNRAAMLNLIFSGDMHQICLASCNLYIADHCTALIRDLQVTKADKDGKPIIMTGKSDDGRNYEKNGHALSALSCLMIQRFYGEYKRLYNVNE